jgi:hypothetical protein
MIWATTLDCSVKNPPEPKPHRKTNRMMRGASSACGQTRREERAMRRIERDHAVMLYTRERDVEQKRKMSALFGIGRKWSREG